MKGPLLAVGLLLFSSAAFSSDGAPWDYSGDTGPDQWAQLSPEYGACAGSNQSPINLTGFIDAELEPIAFNYEAGSEEILNNGHTVQVNTLPGSTITVDDIEFELKQFHFHVPSENLIHGESYPMEGHLVHADEDGNLAVVAVMVTEGQASDALEKAWAQMPEEGETLALSTDISPLDILPSDRDYYRFNGSLTTPPCTEGVRWLVMKQPISASKEQIDQFLQVMGHHNNRPVQAVNARPVLE
ncbi:carbonic anhydrase [Halomonas heilongjiangensis]|uniref:Carbonic anhydrase n=1 Tax=Halomonas heilongjiangensis TaxID=1387883 RepID=A0A2N7TK26_9GAMM|nr:carbonic anhydrase family protein [Halomonas heilongjiangensis]PMR68498.1 carbonic anhydrase [Halomonas heilongjiangensis]PXX86657.1 carbonic anhydrase [Halomonas heilongjiangensis]